MNSHLTDGSFIAKSMNAQYGKITFFQYPYFDKQKGFDTKVRDKLNISEGNAQATMSVFEPEYVLELPNLSLWRFFSCSLVKLSC